jgi:hypothetical protein
LPAWGVGRVPGVFAGLGGRPRPGVFAGLGVGRVPGVFFFSFGSSLSGSGSLAGGGTVCFRVAPFGGWSRVRRLGEKKGARAVGRLSSFAEGYARSRGACRRLPFQVSFGGPWASGLTGGCSRLRGGGCWSTWAGMFLPIAKLSRRSGARLGGRLKAKFKAKNKRRHKRLARHEQ